MDPELVAQQAEVESAARALAARLGVGTADTLPPRPLTGSGERQPARLAAEPRPSRNIEYVDQTPRRPRRNELEIAAEDELGHHWVTVLSIERPVPRRFGDNRGMLPIWVEAHADWRHSGRSFDLQQPAEAMRAIRLAVLGVRSDEHARRLKAALDEALMGREADHESDPLRSRFRNGIDLGDIDAWWTPLLMDALLRCETAAASFEVFGRADHERIVAARVQETVRRQLEGRR